MPYYHRWCHEAGILALRRNKTIDEREKR